MFNLPIPLLEKGALKTWDIKLGYDLACDCGSDSTINISGLTVNMDDVEVLLTDILTELETQNKDVAQTFFTTTVAGSIPAGVSSYTIINLGVDPTDALGAANPMIIGGVSLNIKVSSFGNDTDTHQVLDAAVAYNPNGNTLAVVYNMPV